MTSPITPATSHRAAAVRFGAALTIAMRDNGTSGRGLARTLGIGPSAIHFYRAGVNLPSLEMAARIADVLGRPSLVALAAEARSGKCELCGRPFVCAAGAGNRRFCSEACRVRSNHIQRRTGGDTRERAIVAERRAARYVEAVDVFCRACEPELACRDAACALRVVSPLPLARRRTA